MDTPLDRWDHELSILWSLFRISRGQEEFDGGAMEEPECLYVDKGGWVIVRVATETWFIPCVVERLSRAPEDEPDAVWSHITEVTSEGPDDLFIGSFELGGSGATFPVDGDFARVRIHWSRHERPFVPKLRYDDSPQNSLEEILIQYWTETAHQPIQVIRDSFS